MNPQAQETPYSIIFDMAAKIANEAEALADQTDKRLSSITLPAAANPTDPDVQEILLPEFHSGLRANLRRISNALVSLHETVKRTGL